MVSKKEDWSRKKGSKNKRPLRFERVQSGGFVVAHAPTVDSARCVLTNGVRGRFPCCANLAIQGGRFQLRVTSDCSQSVKAAPPSPDGATGWGRSTCGRDARSRHNR